MKKIKLLSLLAVLFISFYSCKDNDPGKVDFATFEATTYSVGVDKGTESVQNIKVYTNSAAKSERVFNITVVADETTAESASYVMPTSVTIPANSNEGVLPVTFKDMNIGTGKKLVLDIQPVDGLYTGGKITINISRVCAFNIDDFVGTFAAVEDAKYKYDVTIAKGSQPNELVLTNLYDTGGKATITLDNSDQSNPKITFPGFGKGGVLYVHSVYGNVYAVNPSTSSSHDATKDTSTFSSCDTTISLAFVRQVSAGIFSTIINVEMTKK